jgi:hypothetical protein
VRAGVFFIIIVILIFIFIFIFIRNEAVGCNDASESSLPGFLLS